MLAATSVTSIASVPWLGPRVLLRLHRRGFGFARMSWSDLAAAVEQDRPAVLSLDVYDTCLIRDLATDSPIEEAITHRRSQFRRGAGAGPNTNGDRTAVAGQDRSGAGAPPGIDHASDLERELCRPVPGAVRALPRIRAAGTRIVFISDTDRSSGLLAELLRTHGLAHPDDLVVASCEQGSTKSDGDLFDDVFGPTGIVARSGADGDPVGAGAADIWHAGNNPWADGTMAAGAGLRPIELPEAELNRYEAVMAADPAGTGAALAAAARRVRLEIGSEVDAGLLSPHQGEVQVMGAGIAGQALVAFTLWVAEQCRRNDIDHVAFLARDGELPMLLGQAMPADHWDGRPMSYLHCSRMIWGLASASAVGLASWLEAGTSDDRAFLEAHRHDVPLHLLLSRIGIVPEDLGRLSAGRELRSYPIDEPLPDSGLAAWHGLLFDATVGELILERSVNRRRLLTDYLRSQGVDRGRLGLVDVGWRGRLAWHISSVLRDLVDHEPIHLHFGGDKVLPDVDKAIDIRRFAFDGLRPPTPVAKPVSCVETLTASGKPRAVDYRRSPSGEVEPVFGLAHGSGHGDRVELWNGALRVAASLPSAKDLDSWGVEYADMGARVVELLGLWWNTPTSAEARALAWLAFEHDEAGTAMRPLATPYSLSEVLTPTMRQWPQGSEAITPLPLRASVRVARWLKRRLGSDDRRKPKAGRAGWARS